MQKTSLFIQMAGFYLSIDADSRMSISRTLSVLVLPPQSAAPQEQADAQAEQGHDSEEIDAGIVTVVDNVFGIAADVHLARKQADDGIGGKAGTQEHVDEGRIHEALASRRGEEFFEKTFAACSGTIGIHLSNPA